MTPADRYHYSLRWSERDESLIGTVLELPGLKHLDQDSAEVFRGIWNLAHEVVEDFTARGEWVPDPLSGADEIQALLRDGAYRMVDDGVYQQGDPSVEQSLGDARSMLRELRGRDQ
jgi:hypothetical protein